MFRKSHPSKFTLKRGGGRYFLQVYVPVEVGFILGISLELQESSLQGPLRQIASLRGGGQGGGLKHMFQIKKETKTKKGEGINSSKLSLKSFWKLASHPLNREILGKV